ncbi:MAG: GtrA-like protein [Burkholderiales bacterium]|nr:GtrA-like protein [Burkholderiales bacterium]MCE3268191.1 GtrA-like protein [Burkholderiales bacterium]
MVTLEKFILSIVNKRFIIFCISGLFTNGIGYAIFAALIWLNMNFLIANTISFLCAIWISFFMNSKIVFQINTKVKLRIYLIYIIFYVGLLLLSLLSLQFLVWVMHNIYMAQLVNIMICALISYLGLKIIFGIKK